MDTYLGSDYSHYWEGGEDVDDEDFEWEGAVYEWHRDLARSRLLALHLLKSALEDEPDGESEALKYHIAYRDKIVSKFPKVGFCVTEEDVRREYRKIKGEIK